MTADMNCFDGGVLTSISFITLMDIMNQSAISWQRSLRHKSEQTSAPNETPAALKTARCWWAAREEKISFSSPVSLSRKPPLFYVSNKASFNHSDFEHKPLMAPRGSPRQPSWQIPSVWNGKWYHFNRNPVALKSHAWWWKNDEKLHRGKKIKRMREAGVVQCASLKVLSSDFTASFFLPR